MSRRHPSKNRHASPARQNQSKGRRGGKKIGQPKTADDEIRLYGVHAVGAALANPNRKYRTLYASQNALARLDKDIVQKSGCPVEIREPRELDGMVGRDAVHQGLVLVCAPLAALDASELFHLADKKLILVLDQLTDPHNVGAILRSAAAFDVDAVITTHRNKAQENGALAKSASGAVDMVPIIDVRNLSKALGELTDMGFVSFGLDSEGPFILEDILNQSKPDKAVLVLGSEGKGLRQQTREACTHLARLDMPGRIKSLNVSNAAALSLYVVARYVQ